MLVNFYRKCAHDNEELKQSKMYMVSNGCLFKQ